jgi:molybdopterin-guanine dinucleotide biosynthesis protein A
MTGIVLAGGRSRRFGPDKLLVPVEDGRPMALKALAVVESVLSNVYLSVSSASHPWDLPADKLIVDLHDGLGPMGGLHSAMSALEAGYFLVVAGDMPNLTTGILRELVEHTRPDVDATVAVDSRGRLHPLLGIYRISVLPALEMCLLEEQRSMRHLLSLLKTVAYVTFPDDVLLNVNRPADLAGRKQP